MRAELLGLFHVGRAVVAEDDAVLRTRLRCADLLVADVERDGLGLTLERIAQSRIEIDQARLLVLHAAYMMDTVGNKAAKQAIAEIKVAVPNMTLQVVERAMQLHGGGGVSQEFPLASMWAHSRTLRFADGPDEVHRRQIGRLELRKHG